MDRNEGLRILGLSEGCSPSDVNTAVSEKQAELSSRIDAAPTDALRAKYEQMQVKLAEAKALLSTPKPFQSSSPLSATKMADLPGAAPSYTEGFGGGVQAGASLGIQPGHVLMDRYEIKEQIGEGGMGAVYRAYDKTRGSDIAIKVLLPGLLSNEQAKERFLNEARVSSELSHPNIVNVFDVQVDGAFHFITMEILEGQTLRDVMEARKLARQNFSVEEVQETLQPVVDALSYAHKKTVHRDIKPENIFLTEDGDIKLMDFGIARMMRSSQMTQTGAAMGTAYYMAPEQLKGAKDIDGRADQYALGVMVYELLTGDVPAGVIEPLHDMRKDIPKGFSNAVAKALSAKPDGRFADIASFSTGLSAKGGSISMPSGMGKMLGMVGGVAAVGVALFMLISSGILSGFLPEDEDTVQQRYMQAVQLEGEVKELSTRLDNASRAQKDAVREAEGMVRQLEGSLRMARNNRSALERELTSVRNTRSHEEAVQRLMNRAVFESSSYTELKGKKNLAEAMNRDKKYEASIPVFEAVKVSYSNFLTAVESSSPLNISQNKVKDLKKVWDSWASTNQFTSNQAHTDITNNYRAAVSARDQGDLYKAMGLFRELESAYSTLQNLAPAVLKNRSLASQAKRTWESYANAHGLSGLKQVAEADNSYANAESDYSAGKLQASNTSYVSLSKDYSGILEAVENAESVVGKAKSSKKRWEKLVKQHDLAGKDATLKAMYAKAGEMRSGGDPIGASLSYLEVRKGYDALSNGYKKADKAYRELSGINRKLFKHAKRLGIKSGDLSSKVSESLKAGQGHIKASDFAKAIAVLAEGKLATSSLSQQVASKQAKIDRRLAAAKAAKAAKARAEAKRRAMMPAMVRIPSGSFSMGSTDGDSDEQPTHWVSVSSFKMGKYEVTQGQWRAIMSSSPICHSGDSNSNPACVSWNSIQSYIRKLNSTTGKRFRLPTEAEWEYAARAGTSSKWSWGNSEGSAGSYAWYGSNSGEKTHSVGQKRPNSFGLYDMHGNVWEWVEDCWNDSYSGAPTNGTAWLSGACSKRVLRGGSWGSSPNGVRSAYRGGNSTDLRDFNSGFRLVQD